MKNLILFAIGLVICCSCSSFETSDAPSLLISPKASSQTYPSNVDDQNLIAVENRLDSLNRAMFSEEIPTRGWKDFFKRFISVVVADAVGGMFGSSCGPVGTATGAIVASAVAAFVPAENIYISRSCDNDNGDIPQMNPPAISLSSDLVPSQSTGTTNTVEDSIGYYHNMVLMSVNGNISNNDRNIDSLIVKLADISYKTYNTSREVVLNSLNENRQFYETIVSYIVPQQNQEPSLDEVFALWMSLYPDNSQKLSVLKSFFKGMYQIGINENDGDYLNKVLEIINNSSLDRKTKEDLRNAAIVGNASYQLWNVEEN